MNEAQQELALLGMTRTINKTYGTAYSFEDIAAMLADDEYRADAMRAQIEQWSKEQ